MLHNFRRLLTNKIQSEERVQTNAGRVAQSTKNVESAKDSTVIYEDFSFFHELPVELRRKI